LTIVLVVAVIILTLMVGTSRKELEQTREELFEVEESLERLLDEIGEMRQTQEGLLDEIEKLRLDRGNLRDELDSLKQKVDEFEIFEFEATGYAPYDNKSGICNDGTPNTTSTGTKPRPGVVAVNPKIIPYGTIMYIEGYGWGIAEDTGGVIRRRTDMIDLFFYTHDEAYAWGRKAVKVLFRKGEVNRVNNSK